MDHPRDRNTSMSRHHEHSHHDHGSHAAPAYAHGQHGQHGQHGHAHAGHGAMVHAPAADALASYRRAYDQAEPASGCRVVHVELDARETDWEFASGRRTRAWTYNRQVPGPFIDARVGDVLEVRLTNRLPEPTTIHWHGLRLPAAMDGTDMVQHSVAPGETFTSRFRLLDAGTFWYHSHSNEVVQVERGMYGALVVRATDEPVFDRERVLVLSDVTLDADAQVAEPRDARKRHDGREGNVRLLNGISEPSLEMCGGQVERWRIINAAAARYVRLSIGGQPFRILGTDGGPIDTPAIRRDVLLAPGERIDLAVGPFDTGEVLSVVSEPYDRGMGAGAAESFATLRVGPAAPSVADTDPRASRRAIMPLVEEPRSANREVRFSERVDVSGESVYLVNGERHYRDAPVTVGELQVWDIVNASSVDHPFHLHGFFFQIVERNGEPPAFLSWEDTVNVPAGERVRIAWLPDDRPGEWMYHCHILEHHAEGMMGHFAVERADEAGG